MQTHCPREVAALSAVLLLVSPSAPSAHEVHAEAPQWLL
jgi:hypothetical protein